MGFNRISTTRRGRPPKKEPIPSRLHFGSRPIKCKELEEGADGIRRVNCARYDNCLDYAISMYWDSWSCQECKVEEVLSYEQQQEDLEGLTLLLHAIDIKTAR